MTDKATEKVVFLRPCVLAFATWMESRLRANDGKGGWDAEGDGYLLESLEEEFRELCSAIHNNQRMIADKEIAMEAADVANFAMMIAHNYGLLEPGRVPILGASHD